MLNMKSKNTRIVFKILRMLVWVIFVGLSIDAGILLLNVSFNVVKPEWVGYVSSKPDLTGLYAQRPSVFFGVSSLLVAVTVLKASLFYILIRFMYKLDLSRPFNDFAVRQILQLSYFTLSIGLLSYIGDQFCKIALHHNDILGDLSRYWDDGQAFILMGMVVYVIAAIFKTGVDIQNENKLTI